MSLTELLVVIAGLAILGALLLPVMKGVGAKRSEAVCLHQLKQLGVAIFAYAADHQQRLPGPQGTMTRIKSNLTVKLAPYLQQKDGDGPLWYCPANEAVTQRNHALPDDKISSYISHSPLFGYYALPATPEKIPYRLAALMAEEPLPWLLEDLDVWNYPSASAIGGSYLPVHNGGRNVLFADGAVRWVRSVKGVLP